MLITDINDAGASALTITALSRFMQVQATGVWDGATITLEKRLSDGTWAPAYVWSENAFDTVETIGSGTYRTNTALNAGTPSLKFEVTFNSSGGGRVA